MRVFLGRFMYHVSVKCPHHIGEIKTTIGEVNQLVDNSTI
jgi:hypothetical protein